MVEIIYKNGIIYKINENLYALKKDKIGFSKCYRTLSQAQIEFDELQELEKQNKLFNAIQEKRIKEENEKQEKQKIELKEKRQVENEKHITKTLENIMNKDENTITELYYKDEKSNKTISIKHIKNTKTFSIKISRKKEEILFYSQVFNKLLTIRNNFTCGKWYN